MITRRNLKFAEFLGEGEHVATYGTTDEVKVTTKYIPYATIDTAGEVFIPELARDTPNFPTILPLFAMWILGSIGCAMYGWATCISLISILYFLYVRYLYDVRYLIVKSDSITFYSKKTGTRTYPVDLIKFHLSLVGLDDRYDLEIELPDPSLSWRERLMVVESTIGRKTMDGIIAVLIPMLRGDTGSSLSAVNRGYESLPDTYKYAYAHWDEENFCYQKRYFENDFSPGCFSRFGNLYSHIKLWLLSYKANDFLFWLVHGSREKLIAKENQRGSQDV